jgi:hypothetical protein
MLGLGAPVDAKGAGDLPWPQADHIPAGDHGALLRWQVGDGVEEVQVDLGGGRGCGREGRGGELNVLVEPPVRTSWVPSRRRHVRTWL